MKVRSKKLREILSEVPYRIEPVAFECGSCRGIVSRTAVFQGMLRPDLCFACYEATQVRRPR